MAGLHKARTSCAAGPVSAPKSAGHQRRWRRRGEQSNMASLSQQERKHCAGSLGQAALNFNQPLFIWMENLGHWSGGWEDRRHFRTGSFPGRAGLWKKDWFLQLDLHGHLLGISNVLLHQLKTVKDFSYLDHFTLPHASTLWFTGTPLSGGVISFIKTLTLLQSTKTVLCLTASGECLGWQ